MRGHVEQRYPGSQLIIIELGPDPSTGKRRRMVRAFKGTKREAQDEMVRIIAELEQGTYVPPAKTTLGEWLNRWLNMCYDQLSPKSRKRYREVIELRLIPSLGQIRLDKLQPLHIQEFYISLGRPADGDPALPLSPASIRYHHAVLHRALKDAVELKLLKSNPATGLRLPKVTRRKIKPLTPEQINALLDDAKDTNYYIPILLALTCGLRRGEVYGLRWQDVDLDAGRLTINQALGYTPDDGLYFKEAKTEESSATLAIPAITVQALKAHRAEQMRRRLRKGDKWHDLDLVCDRGNGQPCHPDSVTSWFKGWMQDRGISLNYHGLRHAHASWLIALGLHPKDIQERMRHTDISTTMMLYGHLMPGRDQQIADKIQKAITKNGKRREKAGNA